MIVDLSFGFGDYEYYYYKKIERKVVKNNSEIIIILHCRGKQNAINTFTESLNSMLRSDNKITKMLLIVDRDEDVETKAKIIDIVRNLKSRFANNSELKIGKKEIFENFESMPVQFSSKWIKIGILDISPNLDHVIASFIKENHLISPSALIGDYDTVIENAMKELGINIDGLNRLFVEKYEEELSKYLVRVNIKNRICKFFDISTRL